MKPFPAPSSPIPTAFNGTHTIAAHCGDVPDAGRSQPDLNTHREFLISELNQRFKSTLAVVKSIAKRSLFDGHDDVDTSPPASRVAAFKPTHEPPPASQPSAGCLGGILKAEIGALVSPGCDLVSFSGPHLDVDERAGGALSRICRELVTHSLHHGALSAAQGRIILSWMRNPGGDLTITWREHGGPPARPTAQPSVDVFRPARTLESELGGQTDVSSQPDGLRVILTVPQKHLMSVSAIRGDITGSQSVSNGRQRPAVAPGDARVLVVEDNLVIGLDIEETLLDFGVKEVVLVSSVDEALEVAQAGDLTTAVLDFDLGDGKSSLQLAELLAAARVPFVFLSGYSLRSELPDHLSGTPVLNKPVSIARLHSAVEQALSGDA